MDNDENVKAHNEAMCGLFLESANQMKAGLAIAIFVQPNGKIGFVADAEMDREMIMRAFRELSTIDLSNIKIEPLPPVDRRNIN